MTNPPLTLSGGPSAARSRRVAFAFALTFSFSSASAFASPQNDREPARFILEKHCGTCHREDSPQANPKALAIFNLNKPDFAATMTELHLKDASDRLEGLGEATPDERKTFEAFRRAELQRRAARPSKQP